MPSVPGGNWKELEERGVSMAEARMDEEIDYMIEDHEWEGEWEEIKKFDSSFGE